MLGFIKKDLFLIKSNLKFLLILLVIYGIMAYQGQMDLSFLLPFISVVLMMTTFNYDSYNKWDGYAITLPNGRKNSVRSKYLATILILSLATIIVTILSFVIAYARTKTIDYEYILMTMFGCFFATTILESFMYPAIYKFGVEKARIGIFVIVFGIAIIGGFVAKYINLSEVTKILGFLGDYWMIALPIIMILVLYCSYKISEKIYMKKEF